MKIYTKTGDDGKTSLFGGKRVSKNDLRINAYGTVDEVNAVLGISLVEVHCAELKPVLTKLQNDLFIIGSDLATPLENENNSFQIPRIDENYSKHLEELIDDFDSKLPALKNFIIPGGLKGSALLHHARTVCRRAEREVVALSADEKINHHILIYLNRLSDLLFVMARYENYSNGTADIAWIK